MEYATRLLIGGLVRLDDGSDYRNAVFRGCKLEYHGGPVEVDGALFFDCEIAYKGPAADYYALDKTIYRSFYLQGHRVATIAEDGDIHLP